MMRRYSKPLSNIPARKTNTITVDMSDRNGTRWSSPNWLNADLARITDVQGPLPLNHLKGRGNPYQGFYAWLEANVKPETINTIMSNETAFGMSYSAYRHLAQFQARMKQPTNTNREATPAEMNNNV